ncbi:MAG: hypothetical protein HONBIEJF_01964 [Fimbriimonadaceae bacterium]|nr:hypothetical protein [Fimbriimonadaceae bacterium]
MVYRMQLGIGVVAVLFAATMWAARQGSSDRFSSNLKPLKARAKQLGIEWAKMRVFIRAFKHERELELWVSNEDGKPFKLLETYPIAGMSGKLGPKRKQGDLQVPEGFYLIDRFNPNSRYHLSLGIDYPNRSDRIRGDKEDPGGDIFIHGSNVSIGCLAMTDKKIEEIYAVAKQARDRGQRQIQVHIFPGRFETKSFAEAVKRLPVHANFWKELRLGYDKFNETGFPSRPDVMPEDGSYSWD